MECVGPPLVQVDLGPRWVPPRLLVADDRAAPQRVKHVSKRTRRVKSLSLPLPTHLSLSSTSSRAPRRVWRPLNPKPCGQQYEPHAPLS
eukprot:3710252-Rhodomonas_salina.1